MQRIGIRRSVGKFANIPFIDTQYFCVLRRKPFTYFGHNLLFLPDSFCVLPCPGGAACVPW